MKRIFWLPPKFEVLCRVLKVFKMYLSCYSLCLRNKYTDKITYIYPSNLCWDIINLQMDAMDMTWILMAPSSKWGCENIHHRQSIGTYFLILAHMEVFSELSAGWMHCSWNKTYWPIYNYLLLCEQWRTTCCSPVWSGWTSVAER